MSDSPSTLDFEQATRPSAIKMLKFRSATTPIDEILLNLDETRPIILDRPEPEALLEMLRKLERQYIHSFWENVLCKRSSFCPELPFGLSSWQKRTVALIPSKEVIKVIAAFDVAMDQGLQDPRSIPFDSLVSAIRSLEPTDIRSAFKLLSKAGLQRFNTSPLIRVDQNYTDFPAVLDYLIQQAAQPNGRIAAMALVALRAAGSVVLPSNCVRRIRTFDAMSSDGWGSLMELVTPELEELRGQLQPPEPRDGGSQYKNTALHTSALSESDPLVPGRSDPG